jgi:hypothetical protein
MDAYLVRSIRVSASFQEQPNHGQMTILSREDKRGESILRETDTIVIQKKAILNYLRRSRNTQRGSTLPCS